MFWVRKEWIIVSALSKAHVRVRHSNFRYPIPHKCGRETRPSLKHTCVWTFANVCYEGMGDGEGSVQVTLYYSHEMFGGSVDHFPFIDIYFGRVLLCLRKEMSKRRCLYSPTNTYLWAGVTAFVSFA